MSLPTLDALESHRLALTARLDALPAGAVHQAPAPSAWSPAQIVEHFVRIERTMRLNGRLASPLAATVASAKTALMKGILTLPLRVSVPRGAEQIVPSPQPNWAEVKAEWETVRAGWREALPALPKRTVVFKHPLIGLLCVPDALRFVLAHHRHHDAQIARTLAAVAPEISGSR